MNTQAIQKKIDKYMETATPEQIVKEFEDLGVEFVNTDDMNLIQQLQATPKWKEFEEWYENQNFDIYFTPVYDYPGFTELEISFQKGVFEKFIESQGLRCEQEYFGKQMSYYIWTEENGFEYKDSFEALLIWYFNS